MQHKNNTMTSPAADEPYEVGYGKPPQHSRFKPGQSGNRRGRPRGSLNGTTLLDNVLNEKVTITEHGKSRQITKREAMIKQLVNRAVAKGELASMKLVFDLEGRREGNSRPQAGADQGSQQPPSSPGPEERAIPDFEKMSTAELKILMKAAWIMDGKQERPPVPMPPEDPGAEPDDPGNKPDDTDDKGN